MISCDPTRKEYLQGFNQLPRYTASYHPTFQYRSYFQSKTSVLSDYKTYKKRVIVLRTLPQHFCQRWRKIISFQEICNGVLCEAEESFEDEPCSTQLLVLNLRQFVDLSCFYSTFYLCDNCHCVKNPLTETVQ